jgi:hypothetical protein
VIGAIITGVHWGLQQLSFFQNASYRARVVIELVVIFVVAFVVLLLWPFPQ